MTVVATLAELVRSEPPLCTVKGHGVYRVQSGDNVSFIVIRHAFNKILLQGHKDGVERYAKSLDEALEQIFWFHKKHLLEIGWRDRQTLKEQGYYAWEKELK